MRIAWNHMILAPLLLTVFLAGCSGTELPDWMSSEEVDPIITPSESSQLSSPRKVEYNEIRVDTDVRPLSVEDLVKKSSGEGSKSGTEPSGNVASSGASSWNDWENNLKLAPLDPPIEPGGEGSKGQGSAGKSTTEKPAVPAKENTRTPPEEKKPLSRSDILEKLITSESDGGGPVSYKDIQDKLFPRATRIGSARPASRPASRPAKPVVKPVEIVKTETRPADVGPVPIAGRSNRVKKLEMNKEVVISGGAVQVNDQYISADGILNGLHDRMLEISKDLPQAQFQNEALKVISEGIHFEIQQRLVFVEAERALEEPLVAHIDSEIDKSLKRKIAEAGGSEEALRNNYLREGISLESVMENIRVGMMVQAFLQRKFYPQIVINRRTLWNYYRKHKSEFSSEKKVSMQIIAAPFAEFSPLKEFYADSKNRGKSPSSVEKNAAKKAAEKQIRIALKALEAGGDFTAVAKEHSLGPMKDDGGVWELMTAGNKREKKVEDAVFAMKEGERSGIIEEETGFYIVKALKVSEGQVADFVDAQDQIEARLRQDQYNKLRGEYFKKIYDRATIVIGNDFLQRVVERAVERYW